MRSLTLRSALALSALTAILVSACSSSDLDVDDDLSDDAGAAPEASTPRPAEAGADAAREASAPDAAPEAQAPVDAGPEASTPVDAGDAGPAICTATQYLAAGVCQECSGACPANQYQTAACSANADRVCSACTAVADCAAGLTCTTAADSQCTTCANGFVLVEGAAGAADTCVRPKTCADIKRANAGAADGVYSVDPDGAGGLDPFDVYCDMTANGGGWTLVGKIGMGTWPELTQQQYVNLVAHPTSDVGSLLTGAPPATKEIAFFRRDKTNALYAATPYAGQSAVRVLYDSAENNANDGTYFQQRKVNEANWDFWAAVRDARRWSTQASAAPWVSRYGTDFVLTRTLANFDEATNVVTHGTGGDVELGWWDAYTHTLADGTTLAMSRHGGLLGDGIGNVGWMWLVTLNPGDSRFKNESYAMKSSIWLR